MTSLDLHFLCPLPPIQNPFPQDQIKKNPQSTYIFPPCLEDVNRDRQGTLFSGTPVQIQDRE